MAVMVELECSQTFLAQIFITQAAAVVVLIRVVEVAAGQETEDLVAAEMRAHVLLQVLHLVLLVLLALMDLEAAEVEQQ
jgi:hypothetical protein